MVRVKICGITRLIDAQNAQAEGADAVGFVFAKSPRKVTPGRAKVILRGLGPWTCGVGVFVNESPSRILALARQCGFGWAQLHGDEPDRDVRWLQKRGLRVIKAFRVSDRVDRSALKRSSADAVLLDTAVKRVYGGSGKSFDWKILKGFRIDKPIIVSGGLGAANVAGLYRYFRPQAVDASSSLETAPGVKSKKLIQAFIRNAKK